MMHYQARFTHRNKFDSFMNYVILAVFDRIFTYYFRCRVPGVTPEGVCRAQGPITPPLAPGHQQSAHGPNSHHLSLASRPQQRVHGIHGLDIHLLQRPDQGSIFSGDDPYHIENLTPRSDYNPHRYVQ